MTIGLGIIDRTADLERIWLERVQTQLVQHFGEIVPCDACNATGKKGFRDCRVCGGQGKLYASGVALPLMFSESECYCHMHEGPLKHFLLQLADHSFFAILPDGSLLPELCRDYTARPKRNEPVV
jgi:hypothetical protein